MDNILRYRAINIKGHKIRGKYNVNSMEELYRILRNKGYFITNVNNGRYSLEKFLNRKMSYRDLSILCRSLSSMIKSGVQVAQAIHIVAQQYNYKIFKQSLYDVEDDILRGKTLHDSLKKHKNIYPGFMIEMVEVGEQSGKLDEVLEKISEYYEKRYKTFNKLKSAMIYPITVLIVSILVIIFLMTKIIPQFIELLNSFNGEIPYITRIMIKSCFFLRENYLILSISCGLIFLLLCQLLKNNKINMKWHNLKLKLPFIGKFYNRYIMLRFTMVMSMLLDAGVSIVNAIEITNGVIDNKIVKGRIYNCIQEIKKGEGVYVSFKKYNLGNDMILSLVRIGEEDGELDCMLHKAGEILYDDVEEGLKRITIFMEPAVIIFLACFIGIFVVAAFLPIVSIMDSIN